MLTSVEKLVAGAIALAALVAVFTATATAATSGAKPGFMPGTWVGKGTIAGKVDEGLMHTTFAGQVSFVLKVNKKFGVSGTGSWKQTMFGTQDASAQYGVGAMITGTAAITFKGNSTQPVFVGTPTLVTEIRAGSRKTTKTTSQSDDPIRVPLVIKRASTCEVSGTTQVQPKVFLTWSARFKGAC